MAGDSNVQGQLFVLEGCGVRYCRGVDRLGITVKRGSAGWFWWLKKHVPSIEIGKGETVRREDARRDPLYELAEGVRLLAAPSRVPTPPSFLKSRRKSCFLLAKKRGVPLLIFKR